MKIDIPLEVIESMKKIVDMFLPDEQAHYDLEEISGENVVHHIYNDLELVNRFIHSQDLQADIDLAEREF